MEDTEKMISRKLGDIFRIGTVSSVDESKCCARVHFEDKDDMVSKDIPIKQLNTLKNKDYWLPDVDETVLCLFLPNGEEEGFIISSYHAPNETPPFSNKDIRGVVFEDGTTVSYDRKENILLIDVKGDIDGRTLRSINIRADEHIDVTAEGDMTLAAEGNITVKAAGALDIQSTMDIRIHSFGSIDIRTEGNFTAIAQKNVVVKGQNALLE